MHDRPDQLEPETLMREISDLEGRIGELRQAAGVPEPDLRVTLDAALVELELALTVLRTMGGEHVGEQGGSAAAENERRVLRTVFQDAPVPLFLLDRNTSVRRVNRQAATLLGTSSGYVSGKQFTAFCDMATRAAVRSQLAAVVRTGRRRRVQVRFLGRDRPVDAVVTFARVWIRGEPDPMVMVAAGPTNTPTDDTAAQDGQDPARSPRAKVAQTRGASGGPADDEAVATIVHRMDVLATASELLLDEPVFNETVAVRRCARLLAAELADWAFIDLTVPSGGGPAGAAPAGAHVAGKAPLRRQVVMGPDDEHSVEAARTLEEVDPIEGTLPHTVFVTRQSALRPHVESLDVLGTCPDGHPVCGKIGATSVLSVPIEDGDRAIGTITLAASGEYGPFDLMDLGVVQRLGRYLALVIRAARLYRRRAEVAETLQAGLLPRALPTIQGVSVAAKYLTATHGSEVGGDFYDVFRTENGWGLILGDVCGKGEDAAAVTATARHCARLASRWRSRPGDVLGIVNEALLDEDRFVTAVMAGLTVETEKVIVSLGTAGHPPAIVVRADGVIRTAARGGVPLGLFEDFEPGLDTVDLTAGDTLILHSDGVLEACDMMRQEFGQERLLETLAAHAGDTPQGMLAGVERVLLEFCDGDLRDDVSMLAMRVEPPSLT
ncbi:PAS domain S-box-containing protein [Actinomadura pelletieri DSM 43383]|uniref:PAS domain S-box-containing protein n=1 Tax=Actinomadura pelletieri DSM 43383 TaxID=1120940 RepID=A0A495QJ89_9ACTN|nr:SpoIIE family protein phosphatase [Actinomadura pelletieri]RKS72232.1 PAS domain S-box-containing protein [Actinomadura pelletieri DSM 43383]